MKDRKKDEMDARKLRLAKEALQVCNKFHRITGKKKIPLDDVADHLGIEKEDIQDAFDELVKTGEIGDDGDRDHMNYDDSGFLLDLIEKLLLEKQKEEEKEEKEKEIIEEKVNYYT
ncbi:MAG: hypothetical protein GF329_05890 [Candidatus Lokiarchaeota archaeon]|nr:hypothetical protein [Candidatus Lokiarchaeota archaeon]